MPLKENSWKINNRAGTGNEQRMGDRKHIYIQQISVECVKHFIPLWTTASRKNLPLQIYYSSQIFQNSVTSQYFSQGS